MSLDIYGRIPLAECECPKCNHEFTKTQEVFSLNITHNLKEMAKKAHIAILWDWDILNKQAWVLINPLKKAILDMEAHPSYYKEFNANNGWGTYKDFLPWLKKLLEACEKYPHAILRISK
jgi:hypothetical protein